MFGIGESIAVVSGVLSTLKSLNDALSTIRESGANAGRLANLMGKYDDVQQKIQEVEKSKAGVLSVKESMQIQIAKRQAETFHQQLKDAMLMSGQGHQYNEIMKRIEDSKIAHERAVKKLKIAKLKRRKQVKEFTTYAFIAFLTWCIAMAIIYGAFRV